MDAKAHITDNPDAQSPAAKDTVMVTGSGILEHDATNVGAVEEEHEKVELHSLMDCPVCFNPMLPPIHQCPYGHTLCSNCEAKVNNRCPICRQKMGHIRCLVLEQVADSAGLSFPCRYQNRGCQQTCPITKISEHQHLCTFRPYSCPYAGGKCSVTGDINCLIPHLKNDHRVDIHEGCDTFRHRFVQPNPRESDTAIWPLVVFSCLGHHFCLHVEAFRLKWDPVYMAFLHFMGSEDEAKLFRYSLEVGERGTKLTWEGAAKSIRDSSKTVRDSGDGLIIPRNLALMFSRDGAEGLDLRLGGRIWEQNLNQHDSC